MRAVIAAGAAAIMVSLGRPTVTAMLAIPIESLRYPSKPSGEAHRWGFQVRRKIISKDERAVWAPVSRNVMSFLAQIGIIDGITGLSTQRNIEVLPTFTAIHNGGLTKFQYLFRNGGAT